MSALTFSFSFIIDVAIAALLCELPEASKKNGLAAAVDIHLSSTEDVSNSNNFFLQLIHGNRLH